MLWTLEIRGSVSSALSCLRRRQRPRGLWDLEKLLDMKEAGIEVESFVSEELRLQMYQKEVCSPVEASPCPCQQLCPPFVVKMAVYSAAASPNRCLKRARTQVAASLVSDSNCLSEAPHIPPRRAADCRWPAC